jgi:MFS family permease
MRIKSRPVATGSAFLSMFFLGVGVAIVGATARVFGLAPAQIGYLVAAQNVGFGVAVVIAGALSDVYHKPFILTVGLVMLGVAFGLLYRSEIFAVNLAVMVVMGSGMGVAEAVTDAWLLEMHTRGESRLVTVNHLAVSVGSVGITLYLMALELDWQASLSQVAVILGALAALTAFLRPPGYGASATAARKAVRDLSNDADMVLLMLCAAGTVGLEAGSAGVITTFAVERRGADTESAQYMLALFLVGLAAGRVVMGAIGGRGRPVRLVSALALATLVVAILFYLVPLPLPVVSAAAFVLGMTVGPLLPLIIATAGLRFRHIAGTAMGMVKFAIPVGGILIPGVIGLISDTMSFRAALYVFPAVALLVLAANHAGNRRIPSSRGPYGRRFPDA